MKTAPLMSPTPPTVFKTSAPGAELVLQLKISNHGDRFRLEVQGDAGGGAAALIARAELQRILQMLQGEAVKAEWLGPAVKPQAAPAAGEPQPKPARH